MEHRASRDVVSPGQPGVSYPCLPAPQGGVGFPQGGSSTELHIWQGCASVMEPRSTLAEPAEPGEQVVM